MKALIAFIPGTFDMGGKVTHELTGVNECKAPSSELPTWRFSTDAEVLYLSPQVVAMVVLSGASQ